MLGVIKIKRDILKIGIEIEALINRSNVNIKSNKIGNYHHGKRIMKYWKLEGDGSLHNRGYFGLGTTCEFVSDTLTKNTYWKALRTFKDFISSNGKYHFNDTIHFNDTMGSHIHFSIGDINISKRLYYDLLLKLRKRFLKGIENSEVLSENTKDNIKRQYFRNYAKKLTKRRWQVRWNSRYYEFNRVSEDDGKGFEWRGVNLLGVKSWNEFFEVFKIVYECLLYIEKRVKRYIIRKKYNCKIGDIEKAHKQDTYYLDFERHNNEVVVFGIDNKMNEKIKVVV